MCFRYTLSQPTNLQERFNLKKDIELQPRYNIAPTQNVPVIINDSLEMLRWDLVPNWAKDISIGNKMSNARVETVDQNLVSNIACKENAALFLRMVFTNGRKKPRQEAISDYPEKRRNIFGFAELWDSWKAPSGEEIQEVYELFIMGKRGVIWFSGEKEKIFLLTCFRICVIPQN